MAELQRPLVPIYDATPKPALGSVAHPQIDLPGMIERERSVGLIISRRAWLERLESLTQAFRSRMFAKHMLLAHLSLESPGTELVGPVVDDRKFSRMQAHAAQFDPRGLSSPALDHWRDQLQRDRDRDRSGHHGPLHDLSGKREAKLAALELAMGVAPDRRAYKQIPQGELKFAHGGNMTGHQWHLSRAGGQLHRFEKVRQCGGQRMVQHCDACNKRGPKITLTCDNSRLCLGCRKRRVLKFQKRFSAGQKSVMQELWRLQLTRPTRIVNGKPLWGGQWDQKLITFTLPHSGNVVADVAEQPKAWRRMWRLWQEHLYKDVLEHCDDRKELMKRVRYCRVIEVTEGLDGRGHAHMHIWFVGPYVDQARLAHLWGTALSKRYQTLLMDAGKRAAAGTTVAGDPEHEAQCACGMQHERAVGVQSVELAMERLRCRLTRSNVSAAAIEAIEKRERSWYMTRRPDKKSRNKAKPLVLIWKPIVDVRACDKDVADELCKYLIKDGKKVDGQLQLMDPELYAQIYAALEGKRSIAASRGFLQVVMTAGCHCQSCGSTYQRWIESGPEASTGPPAQRPLQAVL